MNCSFCHGHNRKPKQMSEEEFSYVIDKIKDKTEYLYYHLMGEPLTHPKLSSFIKKASESGLKSILTTNGTLIEENSESLLTSGLYKISFSLHSFEEGSNIDHANYVNSIINFAKKAEEQGIIVVFRLWNKGVDGGKNQTTLNLLKESFNGEWVETKRNVKLSSKIYLEWGDRFEWPDLSLDIKGDRYFCYGLKDQFGILVDGTVVPCCLDSNGVINLGNVFSGDINAILNSDRAKNIVNGFNAGKASEELCKKCGFAQRFVKK